MMMPACEIGWEALHLSVHTNGLCAAQSAPITIPSTTPLVRNGAGSVVDSSPGAVRRGRGRGGDILRQQPFSQSGLTHTEPCVASESPWKRYEHLAGLSTVAAAAAEAAVAHSAAVDVKAARRYKATEAFSLLELHPGGCAVETIPIQLQLQSHAGTLQFVCGFFFLFVWGVACCLVLFFDRGN